MTNEEAIQILKTWRITGDKAHEALDMAISALHELKNSSDCVSRKSRLIDADALWMDIIHSMDYCDDILEIIERQPTIETEQKWIPCSERLPEVSKEPYYVDPISGEILFASERVLVFGNNENGYDNAVASHIYSTDVGDEWSGAYDAAEMELTQILAWMPLPEPYKEDADD